MNTIGFVKSSKSGEKRIAILPKNLDMIHNTEYLRFEKGYGEELGFSDSEYEAKGVKIVSKQEALNCDVITDVKLGDADYLDLIGNNRVLFGWAHAVQNLDFTTVALEKKHTVIAWEEIFEDGRYAFYRNREIAGEAAVLHAFRYSKKMPYDAKVAIIGNGQTAKGALRILHGLGANVDVYNRKLEHLFKKNLFNYDVIINCVMWDTSRDDKLIYRNDIKKMKDGTLIIDISCDPYLEIETSHPTTIDNPVYVVDGVIHYCVDNTPAMYPITVSKEISKVLCKYIDYLITGSIDECMPLKDAIVLNKGAIVDKRIADFRKKAGIL